MPYAYPRTLLEFEHWFRTDEACRAYLLKLRWPRGFCCPHCASRQYWSKSRGPLRCGKCRRDTSVIAGTIFADSHLSLRLWFRAVWWVTNQKSGVSAIGLQRMLGLGSYRTAWACLHKLRRAMVRPGRELLSGAVEVDESTIGGRHRGSSGAHLGPTQSLVAVAIEIRGKGSGRIRLQRIPDTSAKTLTGFVQQFVARGTEVITNGRQGYNGLSQLGYRHQPLVLEGKGKQAAIALLPRVHRAVSLLKRWLLGIHQGRVSKKHLDYYLDEFAFRFNRRSSGHRGMLFYRLLQQAVAIEATSLEKLVGKA
jgi:transposase-like protein